jgi:mono/diheme cytochrome c family protein
MRFLILKKLARILFYCGIILLISLAIGITFTIGWRPFVGPKKRPLTDRHFEPTAERLQRGRVVAFLTGCHTCHTSHDWLQHGAPFIAGTVLAGLELPIPLPGRIVSSNITPDPATGAGGWTDDQFARAIREGIGHDGRTLFPMMPYDEFRNMSDEDLAALVVYLRSVKRVRNPLPQTRVDFPVKYLIRNAPEPIYGPVPGPPPQNQIARGKYLVRLGCGCHTPSDKGQPIPGTMLAGGAVLKGPWGLATSANLTPDASGISYYTEATFITAVRTGYVGARKLNSIMPFGEFKELPDEELKAMYAYLRTIPPVRHHVDNSQPPTYCKICRQNHGGGDQN